VKPVREEIRYASKYRLISLLYVADKVLFRLIVDRIMHHVHTSVDLNSNQYGFIPQRGTVDAAMAVKEIIEGNLKQKNCTAVLGLDIRGAFEAAWLPSILHNLRKSNARGTSSTCPEIILAIEQHRYAGIR